MKWVWPLLALLVSVGACSKKSETTPTPSVTVVTITANPPAIGSTIQATATATMSDGSTVPVTTGFTGDNAAVASVTPTGAISGLKTGAVTVSVDFQGAHGTKLLQVLPNYGGTFSGTSKVNNCQDSGSWVGFCANLAPGATPSIGMVNAQSADLRSVTGTFSTASLNGTGSGTVALDGTFVYTGAITAGTLRLELQNWSTNSASLGSISGTFEEVWTNSTASGSARMFCTIQSLIRTSGVTSSVRPSNPPVTLEQMIFLFNQR